MNGDEIKKAREQRLWSQAELAIKLNVANTQVSRWERGGNISKKNRSLILKILFDHDVVGESSKPKWQELAISYRKQVCLMEEKIDSLKKEITRKDESLNASMAMWRKD